MCYLIAKNIDSVGCVALKTTHGKKLVDLKRKIEKKVGYDKIQLVTISRPSAYGEYEPYHLVNTEEEFEHEVDKHWFKGRRNVDFTAFLLLLRWAKL